MPRELRDEHNRALAVLLRGGSTREAAEAGNTTPRTIRRWKHDGAAFQEALEEGSAIVLEDLTLQITMALESVIREARKVLDDPSERSGVKMNAVNSILRIAESLHVLKATEKDESRGREFTRDEILEGLSRHFGFDLGRVAPGVPAVSAGVPGGSLPDEDLGGEPADR